MTVVRGFVRGHQIGIPTINCAVPTHFILNHGIYAGWVTFNNKKYPAAIHYGPRPVFGEDDVSFEAHLLKPIKDAIPAQVQVETVCFIRKVVSFPSVESMISQIEQDVIKIREILTPATIKE